MSKPSLSIRVKKAKNNKDPAKLQEPNSFMLADSTWAPRIYGVKAKMEVIATSCRTVWRKLWSRTISWVVSSRTTAGIQPSPKLRLTVEVDLFSSISKATMLI